MKKQVIKLVCLKSFIALCTLAVIFMGACKSGVYKEMEATEIMLEPDQTKDQAMVDKSCADSVFNTEEYNRIYENPFKEVIQNPLSTFSIDVDNASYSNIRRFLTEGQLPPADAVRIEEMINYFDYSYPQPTGEHPFSIYKEVAACPWEKDHLLVHIALQGKSIDYENLKPSNLVFLVDVSGSMDDPNKLPLVKKSLKMMLENLQPKDRVALVVYAGTSGLVLPSTSIDQKDDIMDAIDDLEAGGSTAGGEGLQLAYKVASENYKQNGNNRVILCTDGDFNVGVSSTSELVRFIEQEREKDIYLTICGFGMGNYKDGRLEEISNAGNGNYFYIDQESEAEKVFVKELRANMFTIAKDVKIQVEFNPLAVEAYRLIGYENRMLNKEDFNNDKKDAGELGAGHNVTALYEVVLKGKPYKSASVDPLKYQKPAVLSNGNSGDLLTVKLRYKPIKSTESKLMTDVITSTDIKSKPSDDFMFAASVTEFGMLLRNSEYKGDATFGKTIALAQNKTEDKEKIELIELIKAAEKLTKTQIKE